MAKRKNRSPRSVRKNLQGSRSLLGFALLGAGAVAGALFLRNRGVVARAEDETIVDQQAVMSGGAMTAAVTMGEGASTNAVAPPAATPGGHVPTDLMGDEHPGNDTRAIDAFRPDPTAPVPPEERDALRPATGAPTLVGGQARELERLGGGDAR